MWVKKLKKISLSKYMKLVQSSKFEKKFWFLKLENINSVNNNKKFENCNQHSFYYYLIKLWYTMHAFYVQISEVYS